MENNKFTFDYLSEYCYKHNIQANADAMSCFCLSFWKYNLSNYKNAIRFKKWFKMICKEYNS